MKKVLVILTLLCFGVIQAQPQKINYQAVAVNASGITVKNRVISLKLSILDSSSIGSVLYSETHQPTTDGSGQFSVYLGGGTAVSGAFSNIPWGNTKEKFLKAEADLSGGTNYVLMGVSQIVSVPYALQAQSANKIIDSLGNEYTFSADAGVVVVQKQNLNNNFRCGDSLLYSGKKYSSISIGKYCMLGENLEVGNFVAIGSQKDNGIIEKTCFGGTNCNGSNRALYTWKEALDYFGGEYVNEVPIYKNTRVQGICPAGWHLPSINEFDAIFKTIDSSTNLRRQIINGTNYNLMFNTLNVAGYGAYDEYYLGYWNNTSTYFWTIENGGNRGVALEFNSNNFSGYGFIRVYDLIKTSMSSVRCLKD